MVACFRPSLSWTYVIELVFMNHDKAMAVKIARKFLSWVNFNSTTYFDSLFFFVRGKQPSRRFWKHQSKEEERNADNCASKLQNIGLVKVNIFDKWLVKRKACSVIKVCMRTQTSLSAFKRCQIFSLCLRFEAYWSPLIISKRGRLWNVELSHTTNCKMVLAVENLLSGSLVRKITNEEYKSREVDSRAFVQPFSNDVLNLKQLEPNCILR